MAVFGVAEEIAVLRHGAAVDRQALSPGRDERRLAPWRAVHDDEVRPLQPAGVEIVEKLAPIRGALAAHVLERQQHLLPVAAHANGRLTPYTKIDHSSLPRRAPT
jgi:hypothetical protein